MGSKKPILSICIPTYNREKYLQILINSIVCQDEFLHTNDIEIVIDDGPSKDNTKKLINNYQLRYGDKIKYFRNDKVVGMCPALLESIELSGGEYTRLIGSDDIITNISLKIILNTIKNNKPGIIFSDRFDFTGNINLDKININTGKNDVIINGVDNFISYLGNMNRKNWYENTHFFTFMSVFCFKQDLYFKNKKLFIENYSKKYNYNIEKNYFNYVVILFSNIREEKIVIIKNKILVLARLANTGWSFNGIEIVKDLYLSIKLFRKNYKVKIKCNLFFNYMLLIWYLPSLGQFIKKTPILRYFYNPLSKVVIKLFYK